MTVFRRFVERAVTKQDYFHLPHAAELEIVDPAQSYYYDLRARAFYRGSFQGVLPVIKYNGLNFTNPIHAAQYGIGHLQNFWDTGEEHWLKRALEIARELVELGKIEGSSLVWRYPLEIRGARNWLSGMAQGQVASFLLRAGTIASDASLMEAAHASLTPFFADIAEGGVRTTLRGNIWFEEYAFEPLPFTLNGFIVALLGLRDASILSSSHVEVYRHAYDQGLRTLEQTLPHFDARGWSRYDLSRKVVLGLTVGNLASPFYHRFHLELLDIMARLSNSAIYFEMHDKWTRTLQSGPTFYTATAEKIIYRAVTANPSSSAKSK